MGSSDKRARDADRNLAIEFVQNAWVDGQLTREEHEERVERVLRAATIADVEREVHDLQGPGGSIWLPTVPPVVQAPAAAPAPEPTPPGQAEADATLVRRARATIVGAAVLIAAVVALGNASQDDQWADEWAGESSSTVDVASLADAVESEFGTTQVHAATVREGMVTVVVPRDGASGQAYESEWDSGVDEWSERTETTADDDLLDLEELDDVDLSSIESDAWSSLDFVEGVEVELRADTFEGDAVCVTATAGGDGPDSVLRYDCDGNPV